MIHTDAMVGDDFRFLTLNTKNQPDFEIILMEPKPGKLMDEATSVQLRAIIEKGVLGAGAFHTDDCRGTYEELKSKGVEFDYRIAGELPKALRYAATGQIGGAISQRISKSMES